MAVAVNDAKRHEVTLVGATLEETMAHRPTPADDEPQNVCLDKAYDSVKVEALLLEWGYTAHIRVHGEKKRGQAKHTGKPGQAMGSLKKLQLDGPISPVVDKVGETNL